MSYNDDKQPVVNHTELRSIHVEPKFANGCHVLRYTVCLPGKNSFRCRKFFRKELIAGGLLGENVVGQIIVFDQTGNYNKINTDSLTLGYNFCHSILLTLLPESF